MQVVKHPKFDRALASQRSQLRQSVAVDRERATAMLESALSAFVKLRCVGESDELCEVYADCEMLLAALRGMDLSHPPDVLATQLVLIERRLLANLACIEKFAGSALQPTIQQASCGE